MQIGDHIASIDDISVVGYRHYEVAKMLKEKKRGSAITLSLYEPIKLGFGKFKIESRVIDIWWISDQNCNRYNGPSSCMLNGMIFNIESFHISSKTNYIRIIITFKYISFKDITLNLKCCVIKFVVR